MTTLLAAVAPTSARPTRAASSDATWRVLRKTSTPRRKIRWSSKVAAVASVGMPSKNSRSPSRVETRSGVKILSGMCVLKFGVLLDTRYHPRIDGSGNADQHRRRAASLRIVGVSRGHTGVEDTRLGV